MKHRGNTMRPAHRAHAAPKSELAPWKLKARPTLRVFLSLSRVKQIRDSYDVAPV